MKRNGSNRAMVVSKAQIPEGWRLVRLGDVVRFKQGGTPSKARPEFWDGEIPFVTGADLRETRISRDNARSFLTNEGLHSGATAICKEGELLLATRTRVGLVGIAAEMMGASQDITLLAPTDAADQSYLYRTLLNNADLLQQRSRGTTIQGVSREDIDSLPILLPPLTEQQAIATVLDSIDDAIEGAEAVIAATGQLRDSLLHELLTRGVPGWHTEWKEAPGLGTIPAGWEVVRLGEVAEVQTGKAVNRKSSRDDDIAVPYLSVANVKDGYLDLGEVKTLQVSKNEIARYSLKAGDVLFTEGGDADKLGRGTVWKEEIPLCLHQNHIFAARPHSGVLKADFLAFFAASLFGKNYFLGAAKQTTNLASVNSTQLREMPVPLPPLREQEAIARLLEGVDLAIERGGDETAVLKLLKESAAAVLLMGRVRLHSSLDCNGSRRIPNLPKEESL